jgi:hypothetical protein
LAPVPGSALLAPQNPPPGHSGGVVSVPPCWLFDLVHAVWSPDGPQACLAWRLSSRVWPRAHRATGGHVGYGASLSAAAAAPKGSDAVAELLGPFLLPGLWHRHAGELLQPWPRPLVAPPGVRVVVRPIRARKSPQCAQDPSQSAPSSGLCDSGRKPSLVRSWASKCMSCGRSPGTDHCPRRSATCTQITGPSPTPGTRERPISARRPQMVPSSEWSSR